MRLLWLGWPAGAVLAQEPDDAVVFAQAGRVVDAAGQAQAGVRVEAWDGMEPERYLTQTTTGAKGRFLLALRRSAVARREHAFAPVILAVRGAAIAEARILAPAGARDLEIRTRPALPLRGVVRDADGRPVPAAVVSASDGARPPLRVREETTTDEQGRFALVRFARETLVVRVNADGLLALREIHRGAANDVRLPETRQLRARFLDAETGAPVEGVRIFHLGQPAAVTDAEGRFACRALFLQDTTMVTPWKEGYASNMLSLRADQDHRLARVAPLRGRVVDEQERPVPGARLSIHHDLEHVAWSDADGRYEFRFLPRGLFRLGASKPGYVATSVRLEAGRTPDRVTLQLLHGGRVSGWVRRDGQPVLGVRVCVHDDRQELAVAFTDAQGRFLVQGVPGGARYVQAREEGRRSVATPVAVGEGGLVGPLGLALKAHLALRGVVRGDTGRPLAGATVRCGTRQTRTDGEGRFAFESLPVRRYDVVVEAPRHAPVEVASFPGRPLALVAESRFGEAELTVAVPEGVEAEFTLGRREEPRVLRTVTARGGAVFRGLLPGRYDLQVKAPGFLDVARVVDLPEAGRRLDLKLERGGTLRLMASPGAAVAIQRVTGRAPPVVALRLEEGARELRDFGPGRYRFIARAPGELIVVREIDLGPNTPPQELDLRGGRESTLVVAVRDAAGTAIEGAEITLVAEGGFAHRTRRSTKADGRAVLQRLIAGRIHVRAERGRRMGETAVDVTPGARLAVEIVLR
ncbi:MAG: carboxypeptidase regulatory-like domain-containing protein [Planctomycetota bacterium]|jgi:protocatechuate 3,4-dioxygenase beta subunit